MLEELVTDLVFLLPNTPISLNLTLDLHFAYLNLAPLLVLASLDKILQVLGGDFAADFVVENGFERRAIIGNVQVNDAVLEGLALVKMEGSLPDYSALADAVEAHDVDDAVLVLLEVANDFADDGVAANHLYVTLFVLKELLIRVQIIVHVELSIFKWANHAVFAVVYVPRDFLVKILFASGILRIVLLIIRPDNYEFIAFFAYFFFCVLGFELLLGVVESVADGVVFAEKVIVKHFSELLLG